MDSSGAQPAADSLAIRLAGRVAFVTGSSRNIGRAIALAFARAGADVVVHARSSCEEVEGVVAEARALGVRAVGGLADVRDPVAIERLVAEAAALGPIDVLVNCAAIRREGPFDQMTLEEWREGLSVVLDGAFVCTRAVVGGMLARQRGTIVNIIGLTGQSGAPERAHVVTAKSGLIGFTKALALEYGGRGITVNGVSPGMIATDRGAPSATADPLHRRARVVPVGREGRPEEVASLCCYLASEEARFITGQILAVNGGTYL
jgi:3-oxoacyl-[acyl-carrier protein] reductase